MLRPVFCSEDCTKQANKTKTKQTEQCMKCLVNALLIPMCIIPSARCWKLHMEGNKNFSIATGETAMHSATQSLGVCFESTPTSGTSVMFLCRNRLKSWKLMAWVKPASKSALLFPSLFWMCQRDRMWSKFTWSTSSYSHLMSRN